ncbi:MAG: DUF3024 domain-containing protein [Gemmatimonadota bacterium]
MPLSDFQQAQVEKLLRPIVARADRPDVRDQLRLGYRIEGNAVVLFESRVMYNDPSQWIEEPVAKFRYVASISRWRLFCMFRDLKWRGYELLPEAPSLDELVAEVLRDPTGIFWG